MLKKIFNLFKIIRKLSISGAVDVLDEIKPMPKIFKLIFHIFSFGSNNKIESINKTSGEKLCEALQSMGTTFIKLGQFLATRPDIIGDEIAKKLERLQDKLPAFSTNEAKEIIKNEIGIKSFNNIILLEDSVAAASIAQVHFAKNKNWWLRKRTCYKNIETKYSPDC